MPSLLDINVLIALIWSHHIHHRAAHDWFDANRVHGWVTCPLTEAGFLRISMQPAAIKIAIPFPEVFRALNLNVAARDHMFWPLDYPLSELQPEIQHRIRGTQQLTDAILLDLAIRHKGRLVTFDRRIGDLLPADSPHRAAIEYIGV